LPFRSGLQDRTNTAPDEGVVVDNQNPGY
jgi:hypothetical protein